MNYTSAQANKLLKKLNDEYTALLDKETRSRDFRAAMGEDVESVRPVYDYAETQIRLAELEAKIRKLKHAINIFNATQTVDSFDMTIDELLVYIPQLTKRKSKLLEMKSRLPKERVEEQYGRQSSIIDYTYANYDIAAVEADYEKAADELSRAQLALDAVNQRETFEFEDRFPSFHTNVRPFLIQSRSLRVFSVQRQRIGYFDGYPLCSPRLWFMGNIYRQHR